MDTQQFIEALGSIGFVSVLVSVMVAFIKVKLSTRGNETIVVLAGVSIILGAVCSYVVQIGWGETIIAVASVSQIWYGFFMGDVQQSRSFQNYVR